MIQLIYSDAAEGKGIPYAEYPEYNDSISVEIFDKIIGLKFCLSYEGEHKQGIVRSKKRSSDSTILTVKRNDSCLLDTRIYKIEFLDRGRK